MRRGRQHRAPGSAGKRGKLIAYAGFGVLVCGAAFWSFHGHDGTGVPVITADARPIRIRPADPGGLSVNLTGNFVFSGDVDDSHARLAAPAETPNTKALRASERIRVKSGTAAGDHLSDTKEADVEG